MFSMKPYLLSLLFLSQLALAQLPIHTIQLNHRIASELLPTIEAMLPKQATAKAANEWLIIKADDDTAAHIKQLVQQLDTPIQKIKISLYSSHQRLTTHSPQLAHRPRQQDTDLAHSQPLQRWSTHANQQQQHYYEAQGVAESPITVLLHQQHVEKQFNLQLQQNGEQGISSTNHYYTFTNGFQAVARVLPNYQVVVDIHPQLTTTANKAYPNRQRSELITRLSGPINTWLMIGQMTEKKSVVEYGSTRYQSHREPNHYFYLKVELL